MLRIDPWASEYDSLIGVIPEIAGEVGVTFCGMNACVDARYDLHDVAQNQSVAENQRAREFVALLTERAAKGIGGEIRVEWPEGPEWLRRHAAVRYALGG